MSPCPRLCLFISRWIHKQLIILTFTFLMICLGDGTTRYGILHPLGNLIHTFSSRVRDPSQSSGYPFPSGKVLRVRFYLFLRIKHRRRKVTADHVLFSAPLPSSTWPSIWWSSVARNIVKKRTDKSPLKKQIRVLNMSRDRVNYACYNQIRIYFIFCNCLSRQLQRNPQLQFLVSQCEKKKTFIVKL